MTTPELLQKLSDFFESKTKGIVSNQIFDILPDSGPVLDQLQELGILDDSLELIHLGAQVKPVIEDGEVIDVLFDDKPLLNLKKPCSYELHKLSEDSFEIAFKSRQYKILSINRKKNKLNCTIRLEVADKIHVDTLNLYQSSHKNKFIQGVCQTFLFPVAHINEDFHSILKVIESYQFTDLRTNKESITDQDKKKAIDFGKSENLFDIILKDYEKLGSTGEENNKLISYIASVSRLFEKPLSVMVISSSGAGKSDLVTKTLNFLPPEDLLQLTSLSAKALFYKDENSLKAKILSLEEDAGGDTASYAIRQLISSSALTVETTIRDQLDGKIKTQQNKVHCQTAVFVTSTNANTDPETKSRFFILHVDESKEQTQRIINLQKNSRSLKALTNKVDSLSILNKHRNLHRLLKYYPIVNPYIDSLNLSNIRLNARRNFPKFLCLIDSICLLRQFQKEVKTHHGHEYLEVEKSDLKLADKLFKNVIDNSVSELNSHSRELLKFLKLKPKDQVFTRKEIRDSTDWGFTKVRRSFEDLLKHELLVLDSGGRGKVHSYKLC
jgi:hypothetical protein